LGLPAVSVVSENFREDLTGEIPAAGLEEQVRRLEERSVVDYERWQTPGELIDDGTPPSWKVHSWQEDHSSSALVDELRKRIVGAIRQLEKRDPNGEFWGQLRRRLRDEMDEFEQELRKIREEQVKAEQNAPADG